MIYKDLHYLGLGRDGGPITYLHSKYKLAIQLAFDILRIDETEARRRVEVYLEPVRVYRQIGFVRRQAALTANPEPRYHGSTNAISRTTENIAVWNTVREAELERQSLLLDLVMGRLKKAGTRDHSAALSGA
ncbi:hypothetical protein A3844_08265 [Paenibacillus helianthi]|uniref:Uncharacterized protein n=1 Tax=Paenibacillus helianthi TaxID=1349432 RepID=A0ABX3ER17_9BACL|nr:hypothetical protein [Paenibacillus helianthi]OKP88358.1 hypothetical protein A3844_08265 [Paenibacillus helianthi]